MYVVKSLSALFATLMLVTSLGCASSQTKEGTGEYVDDSVITTKVKAAILGEPGLKVAEINVETFKGVVQLSGFVSSRAVCVGGTSDFFFLGISTPSRHDMPQTQFFRQVHQVRCSEQLNDSFVCNVESRRHL